MAIRNLGDFLPDIPVYGNQGLITAKNVIPINGSYQPFKSLNPISNALENRCMGAIAASGIEGGELTFVGDKSKLYSYDNVSTFTDLSQDGGYNTPGDGKWSMSQFSEHIIASNYIDPIQVWSENTKGTFEDLSATAPRAKHLAVVKDFLFMGNVIDSLDGIKPDRLWWSPIGNPRGVYSPSQSTQCDYQDLPDAGHIQGIVAIDDSAIVITDKTIQRFVYEGTPKIFGRYLVESDQGTEIPSSIISFGRGFFYYGNGGFQMFNGSNSVPIGDKKIDKYFENDLDRVYAVRTIAGIDPINKLAIWAYTGSGHVDGVPNKQIIYNWAEGRWSHGEADIEFLFQGKSQGMTMEDLDAVSPTLEGLPFNLDSKAYMGRKRQLVGFNGEHKFGYFDGDPLTAEFETGEFQPIENRHSLIQEVRPIIEGGTVTIQMGVRDNLVDDDVEYGLESSISDFGTAEVDSSARYHRIKVSIADGFKNAAALEFDITDDGV